MVSDSRESSPSLYRAGDSGCGLAAPAVACPAWVHVRWANLAEAIAAVLSGGASLAVDLLALRFALNS